MRRYLCARRSGSRGWAVLLLALLLGASFAVGGGLAGGAGPAAPDAPDDRENAEPLAYDETIEANLSDGEDVDWYRVNATAGNALVATVYGHENENRSYSVRLYTASGAEVTEQNAELGDGVEFVGGDTFEGARGRQPVLGVDVTEYDGPYYVKVSWHDDHNEEQINESLSVPYNLTVTTRDLGQHDPNENATSATPISVGQSTTDVIAPYDQDVYAVELEAGTNYTVRYEGAAETTMRKAMGIFAGADNVTEAGVNDPVEGADYAHPKFIGNQTLRFTAREDGTYYVVLGQYQGTVKFLVEDSYTLTVERTDDSSDAGDSTDTPTANRSDGDTPGGSPADEPAAGSPTASHTADQESPGGTPTRTGESASDGTPTRRSTDTGPGTASPTDRQDATAADGPGDGGGLTPSPTGGAGAGFTAVLALLAALAVTAFVGRR